MSVSTSDSNLAGQKPDKQKARPDIDNQDGLL
jgi:hypothetical protein